MSIAIMTEDKLEPTTKKFKKENHYSLNDDNLDENVPLNSNHAVIPSKDIYLDTINRHMLDFDFEKVCSVSLSNLNVYACLVCGKYYQGRGKSSHAYFHSLHENHHIFINLHTLKVYCLPDGYEIIDPSLDDIKYVLHPFYTKEQVSKLNSNNSDYFDLNNRKYLPGFVGMNNIKENDYVNVVVQALTHIKPLRDYFLLEDLSGFSELVRRFGTLTRKVWNSRAFKGQVSPHELVQEIANSSKKKFTLDKQADPIDFLSWFLNILHRDLGGTKKQDSSIIYKATQGELRIYSQAIIQKESSDKSENRPVFDTAREVKSVDSPFLFLTLDLPPPPLFQDEVEKNIIPQIPLTTLLRKYDGVTTQETAGVIKRYKLLRLPQLLIFHIKRYTKNNWDIEKNSTIVNFPIKNINLTDFVDGEKDAKYDLLANICVEGNPRKGEGSFKVHVHSEGKEQWYQIQDLIVEAIMPQMIFLSESYIQIWQRQNSKE